MRMPISICVIPALAMAILLEGCGQRTEITITNRTSKEVRDLTVLAEGRRIVLGSLNPGEITTISERLDGEGASRLIYTIQSDNFSHQMCYYTIGSPAKGEIEIGDNNIIRHCR